MQPNAAGNRQKAGSERLKARKTSGGERGAARGASPTLTSNL